MKKRNLIFVCILAIVILFVAGVWFDSVFGGEKMECQKFEVTYEIQYNEITLADAAVKEEGFRLNYGDECEINISVDPVGSGYITWYAGSVTANTNVIQKSKTQKFKVVYSLFYESYTLGEAAVMERHLRETYTDVCGIKVCVNNPEVSGTIIYPYWGGQNNLLLNSEPAIRDTLSNNTPLFNNADTKKTLSKYIKTKKE